MGTAPYAHSGLSSEGLFPERKLRSQGQSSPVRVPRTNLIPVRSLDSKEVQ